MGLDLYDWLTSTDRLNKGKNPVSSSSAFIMASGFSFLLLYCGIFSDLALLIQIKYISKNKLEIEQ
jgi:hypothetical protein